ncbi:MAG: GGDEF domain-containing protein [Candidatus Omnitrophica bacterium]|nr:GGDEF domain-containing protein [Candidatus Omnitrophota bacterium]
MDTEAAIAAPLSIRGLLAGMVALLGAVLALALTHRLPDVPYLVPLLCLSLIAISIAAWMFYSIRHSLGVSAIALVVVSWAWAAQPRSGCAGALVAGLALMGLAAWRKQQQIQQLHGVLQLVEDVQEEQAVATQTMTRAQETREALQKKMERYAQLQTFAERLSHLTDLDAVVRLAVEQAFELIGKSDACLLLLVDPARQGLSLVASKRRKGSAPIRLKQGDHIDRHVLRSHVPLLVNEVRRDFRFPMAVGAERTISSVIACPLLVGHSPSGVLRLDAASPDRYTQDDLRLLGIVTDLIATAVANAMLFARTQELAMTDGLTGVMLRRPLLEQLAVELARAARMKAPVALLILDIDHFKTYNDTFGHTTGDLILKHLARLLRAAAPEGALLGRYGGEEFLIVLPQVGGAMAAEVAERLRRRVERHADWGTRSKEPLAGSGGVAGGGVTVSVGVASYPADAETQEELIRLADGRLYRAKREGRNRVCAT